MRRKVIFVIRVNDRVMIRDFTIVNKLSSFFSKIFVFSHSLYVSDEYISCNWCNFQLFDQVNFGLFDFLSSLVNKSFLLTWSFFTCVKSLITFLFSRLKNEFLGRKITFEYSDKKFCRKDKIFFLWT